MMSVKSEETTLSLKLCFLVLVIVDRLDWNYTTLGVNTLKF